MSAAVRLVASDLDGTLLDDDQTVSVRTLRAIEALVAAGVHVVAATGRSEWTAAPLLAAVPDIELIVCSNGASLYDTLARRSVASYPIAEAVVDAILAVLAADLPGCRYGWETDEDLHYEAAFLALRPVLHREPAPNLTVGDHPTAIRKLMIAHERLDHYELLDAILPLLPAGCEGSTSGAPFVEVTGKGVDKAFGLQQVCHRLSIVAEEVVAFGDHHNDVPMLQWAGRGIAMSNAHDSVRQVVAETTASNLEDGVAAILETLV